MSTELIQIPGMKEGKVNTLQIVRFWEENKGVCIQLTTSNDYVQLTRSQVEDLVITLYEFMEY